MLHQSRINFARQSLTRKDVEGQKIIEVGSLNIISENIRPHIESHKPSTYIGVDITMGYGVDEICDAINLTNRYGLECFDALVTLEVIEHIGDWKKAVNNFKELIKPNGIIVMTTRSRGFRYHGFPADHWRFEEKDMRYIFSDFIIEKLEKDPLSPGVFIKARKPERFSPKDISSYGVYSVVAHRKIKNINKFIGFFKVTNSALNILRKISPLFLKDLIKELIERKNSKPG